MEGRTMEDVFRDYKSRRNGLIKALTVDVREFYRQCDPEKENLSLYAFPDEKWEVNLPAEEVPPELPEPVLGINFSRDGMSEEDWIKLVAVHSDAWLISLSFYFAQRFGFDKSERRKLFDMINSIPTVFEVVTGTKEAQEVSSVTAATNGSNKKRDSASKPPRAIEAVVHDDEDDEDGEEGDEDEHKDALCGHCNRNDSTDAFWICCDICEIWFHGKCVKVTPAKAQHIKQYKCPACSTKKMRI